MSSNTMVEVFEHLPIGTLNGMFGYDHPHDPSDFNRCAKLLDAVPEYRSRLYELSILSPTWKLMVDKWDELESLLVEEFPNGKAPKTYKMISDIIESSGGVF